MSGVADYSTTPASNTSINSIGIAGTNSPANFDNGLRQLMADLATARTDGALASMPYATKSAGYTLLTTDRGKLIDCTAALEIELLAAASAGAGFFFVVKGNGGAVTLDPNGVEEINGSSTSATVADGTSALVVCNGTAWFTISVGAGDVTQTGTQTLTNKTLTLPQINDTSSDHQYVFAVSELTADRTVTLPLLAANDEFVFKAHNIQAQATWEAGVGTTESLITPAKLGAAITALAPAAGTNPIGTVAFYGGTAAPTGWLLCYGQAVSRATYSDLFTAISTTYGAGDGSTTFNLPDIRGRVIAGQDDMGGVSADRLTNQTGGLNGDTLGATGGAETHALTAAQIPDNNTTDKANGASTAASATHTGTGSAHNNVQPTIILNAIIYAAV
jgi:microcystin-dependent protein